MNGIGLLVLIVTLGQISFPNAGPPAASDARDFGWQITKEESTGRDIIEFIVQISPEKAAFMNANNEENLSDLPPELVGRVTRFVTRIGTAELPRTPSLAEIERRYPRHQTPGEVTASLGDGRFSDIDPDAVVNAQGGGIQLPNFPAGGSNLQAKDALNNLQQRGGSLIDDVQKQARAGADALANSSLGSKFLEGARNGLGVPTAPQPNSLQPNPLQNGLPRADASNPNFPGTGGSNKYAQTGQSNGNVPAATPNLQTPPAIQGVDDWKSGLPNMNDPAARIADNRGNIPRQGAANGSFTPQTPPSLSGSFGQLPDSVARARQNNGLGGGGLGNNNANSGYGGGNYGARGNVAGGYGTDSYGTDRYGTGGNGTGGNGTGGYGNGGGNYGQGNQGYGNDRYTAAPNGSNQGYGGYSGPNYPDARLNSNGNLARAQDNVDRIANAGLPGTGAATPGNNNSPNDQLEGGNAAGSSDRAAAKNGNEVWLQIFFLVSLIVNVYLGMLIRKLLTRYRSLLGNVRGQIA